MLLGKLLSLCNTTVRNTTSASLVLGITAMFLKRQHQFTCRTLVAERILLSQGHGFLRKGRVLSELGVRGGRPELRMQNGSIVLMDSENNTRLQADAQYTPAPQVRSAARAHLGSGQAWADDRHGRQQQLEGLRNTAAIVAHGPDACPLYAYTEHGQVDITDAVSPSHKEHTEE